MSRVLHTADVHIDTTHEERIIALRRLLRLAEEREVELVTIGGDLFDRPEVLDQLRPKLRNDLFTDRPFDILLIPGNHDEAAFRGDIFFGNSCAVLDTPPFESWIAPDGDLRVVGLPYRDQVTDELLLSLQNRNSFDGTEVLLLHCSLNAPFGGTQTGDEGARQYFPVTEGVLTELGFDYYLAGHYHSQHKVSFDDGSEFTYPGTPASTRSSETGRRQVAFLDPEDGISFETLHTFHYASTEFVATPGDEESLLDDVREWASTYAVESAEASIRVEGFVEMDEERFYDRLAEAAGRASVTDATRSVEHILSHPLYRSFTEELEETRWDEDTRRAVTERTLAVFSELSSRGDI